MSPALEIEAAVCPSSVADEPELDRRQVQRSFARAAARYERHHALQVEVAARLRHRLPKGGDPPDRVLDIGAGTGLGAQKLKRLYPQAEVLTLDLALPMLRAAQARDERLRGICADARRLPLADSSVDLLYSSLCIQWIREPVALFAEFRRVLRPTGSLAISTLGPATLQELRQAWAAADAGKERVGRFLSAEVLRSALSAAGFPAASVTVESVERRFDSPLALLQELKGLGATNAEAGRPRALTGKSSLAQMSKAYEKLRSGGTIPSTWEVIYIQG